MYGAPGRIRTSDRSVRSRVLYPAELQAHIFAVRELSVFRYPTSMNNTVKQQLFDNLSPCDFYKPLPRFVSRYLKLEYYIPKLKIMAESEGFEPSMRL